MTANFSQELSPQTCSLLDTIANDAVDYRLGTCTRNDGCTSIRCVDPIPDDIFQDTLSTTLTFQFCTYPPSIHILIIDAVHHVQVDAIVNETGDVPYADDIFGTLNVRMEYDLYATLIGFGVSNIIILFHMDSNHLQ